MSQHRLRSAAFVLALLTCVAGSAAAQETRWLYREAPDDPPARPARADPAARSLPTKAQAGPYVSVQVNVDEQGMNVFGDAANEPSIAVDPTNPANVVIGWRQFDNVTSNFRQAGWGYSRDGGRSWTFGGVLGAGGFRSDPVLDADSSGRIFFQSLYFTAAGAIANDVWRSSDAGTSWQAGVDAFGGDKNWMTVDASGGPGDGNVYASYSTSCRLCQGAECCPAGVCCSGTECCFFAVCCDATGTFVRSTDGGDSYRPPVPFVPGRFIQSTIRFMTLAVGPDGELYVGGEGLAPRFQVFRSDDARSAGAATFTPALFELGGLIGSLLPPNPGGLLGQAWIDVDRSGGPRRGHVYLLASVVPDAGGDPMDVHFVRSTDGGATWSAPRRLNDDGAGNWQWFAAMSVAPNGRIDAVWNDTRASGVATVSELYYAYSWDGGETFSPNVPVSPPWDSTVGWPNNDHKIGDYYDLVSDDEGAAVAYAATLGGEQDVYFVRVFPDCNGNGVSDVRDVAAGTSRDFDGDLVPDECEPMFLSPPDPGAAGAFNTFAVEGAFAGSRIRFLWSTEQGSAAVPACAGLTVDLAKPRVLGEVFADGEGTASVRRRLAEKLGGRTLYFQAVDRTACRTGNAVASTLR